jgi:hypothetical protein
LLDGEKVMAAYESTLREAMLIMERYIELENSTQCPNATTHMKMNMVFILAQSIVKAYDLTV